MKLIKDRDAEPDRTVDSLLGAWRELDQVRAKWIENPLDPILRDELAQIESRVAKLEERYSRVVHKQYGSWYGIDQ